MITSPTNSLIKHAVSLKQKKYRDQFDEYVVEGCRAANDLLSTNNSAVKHIFITKKTEELFDKTDLRLVLVSDAVMQKISDTVSPQEVVVVASRPKASEPTEYVLFLDKIRDPGNLGTIMRTALACGFFVYLNDCADIFSPKVVRSSMSTVSSVKFGFANGNELRRLKDSGYKIIAADMGGRNLFSCQAKKPVCIVVGSEADGIERDLFSCCDEVVAIPMEGTESLNAAIAASIMMYHYKYSTKGV